MTRRGGFGNDGVARHTLAVMPKSLVRLVYDLRYFLQSFDFLPSFGDFAKV